MAGDGIIKSKEEMGKQELGPRVVNEYDLFG